MVESLLDFSVAIGALLVAALVLLMGERNCRSATAGIWSWPQTPYVMAILVVLMIMVSSVWMIKASLLLIPHKAMAIAAALGIVVAVLFGSLRIIGKHQS